MKSGPQYNIVGMKFDRLLVTSFSHMRIRSYWHCICDCGTHTVASGNALKQGKVRSCGCLKIEETTKRNSARGLPERYRIPHAERHPANELWRGMISRCRDPRDASYARYGAVGITVCDRWAESFVAFLDDMGARPSPKHSIDRIDNDDGYRPGNCRWATAREQARNRRNTVWAIIDGAKRPLVDLADEQGLPRSTVWQRVTYFGWTPEEALNLKPRSMK